MFETVCDVCKVKPAYQRVQVIDRSGRKHIYMCRDCYYERQKNATIKIMDNIAVKTVKSSVNVAHQAVCSMCNTTEAEFKKTSVLGCENCYRDLARPILRMIQSAQGGFVHKGKTPEDTIINRDIEEIRNANQKTTIINTDKTEEIEKEEYISDIQKLKIQLEKAIRDEEFEFACRLRDEINLLANKEE